MKSLLRIVAVFSMSVLAVYRRIQSCSQTVTKTKTKKKKSKNFQIKLSIFLKNDQKTSIKRTQTCVFINE